MTGRSSRSLVILASAVSLVVPIASTCLPLSTINCCNSPAWVEIRSLATRPSDSSSRDCEPRNSRAKLNSRLVADSFASSSLDSCASIAAVSPNRIASRRELRSARIHSTPISRTGTDQSTIQSRHMTRVADPDRASAWMVQPKNAVQPIVATAASVGSHQLRLIVGSSASSSQSEYSSSSRAAASVSDAASSIDSSLGTWSSRASCDPIALILCPPAMARQIPQPCEG